MRSMRPGIDSDQSKGVKELAEGTRAQSGQVMCAKCFNAWFKEKGKANDSCQS